MQNILKLFGAKDSASFEKRFNRSLIVLTLIYSVTLGVILFISATVSYSTFSFRVGARFDKGPGPGIYIPIEIKEEIDEIQSQKKNGPTIEEVREDLIESFVMVNGILFLLAVIASYFLARITLKPLKSAYEDQRRFIADASHELRTPLAVMHIELENELTELTHKKLSKEKTESYLEEVTRMSKIVQDLLYLSKLENSHIAQEIESTDIQETLESVVKRLQPLAHSKEVELNFMKNKEEIFIKGNTQISQIFTNIVQNAIIYNKPEGSVQIDIKLKDSDVDVYIKDTGIGMSETDLKHIFDRFYRADKSRSRALGGSGLGLSIVERIMESVDGKISIESESGKGTVVKVSFLRA
jgi:signal transduction histidine kinase